MGARGEGSDVTSNSIGPGTVLAGRYRLDDLLTESEGARFWRATDTILARSVAVHAVPSDDERAPGLLEAARVSATVTDPHLLRVLDCDDEGGITWVVNEWGDGVSLDLMLQQGTLPPSRAAWLTREVADAIAAGHAQGIAHGRLNPEAVLVTQAGAVKLIGYVVDASLQRGRPPDPLYGELDEREADVINLAGVLYAGLTGRWPGVAPVRRTQGAPGGPTPAAPPPGARRCPPHPRRHLRAGAAQGGLPARDADRDRAGDRGRTGRLPRRLRHGRAARPRRACTPSPPSRSTATPWPREWPTCTPRPWRPRRSSPTRPPRPPSCPPPAPRRRGAGSRGHADLPGGPAGPRHHGPAAGAERAGCSPAALRGPSRSGRCSPARSVGCPQRRGQPRPLELPRRGARRRPLPRRRPRAAGSTPPPGAPATPARGSGRSPTRTRPRTTSTPARRAAAGCVRRSWSASCSSSSSRWRSPSTAAARTAGPRPARRAPPSRSPRLPTPVPRSPSPAYATSTPTATRPRRTPTTAKFAIDGDPSTSWTTVTYRGNPALGGLKPGVGLMLDLGKEQKVSSLTVHFKGTPTSYDVYAAPAGVTEAPDSVDQLDKVGGQQSAPEKSTATLDSKPSTRYLLVWLTRLPKVGRAATAARSPTSRPGRDRPGGQRRLPRRGTPGGRPRGVRRALPPPP